MNLKADINIFLFFVPSNFSPPYRSKLIRLPSLTVEKKIEIFPKSFIAVAQFEL